MRRAPLRDRLRDGLLVLAGARQIGRFAELPLLLEAAARDASIRCPVPHPRCSSGRGAASRRRQALVCGAREAPSETRDDHYGEHVHDGDGYDDIDDDAGCLADPGPSVKQCNG